MDTTQLVQLFAALAQNAQNNTDYLSPETLNAFANKATAYQTDLRNNPMLLKNNPKTWMDAVQTAFDTGNTISQMQSPDPLNDLLNSLK